MLFREPERISKIRKKAVEKVAIGQGGRATGKPVTGADVSYVEWLRAKRNAETKGDKS